MAYSMITADVEAYMTLLPAMLLVIAQLQCARRAARRVKLMRF